MDKVRATIQHEIDSFSRMSCVSVCVDLCCFLQKIEGERRRKPTSRATAGGDGWSAFADAGGAMAARV
ncbi:hypothetical protein L2E82_10365 [Cichorium intybus]|uniref:Uncharacterized protein n=1 Tax=Cichorium intybus TaxID=13427 RepID=A0ACB9G9V5_CICIN|nr:hypothetical protein L2E82_10365 [Cichorium intybus]